MRGDSLVAWYLPCAIVERMDRETKSVTTPSGIVVELKAYLIGREKRELQNAFLGNATNFSVDSQEIKGIDAAAFNKAQDIMWRTVVVSIGGKKAGDEGFDVVEAILDMKSDDYEFVAAAVNDVTNDKKK